MPLDPMLLRILALQGRSFCQIWSTSEDLFMMKTGKYVWVCAVSGAFILDGILSEFQSSRCCDQQVSIASDVEG